MDTDRLRELLERLQAGRVDVDGAVRELKSLPFADLGYARVDHHRALRLGMPEVILGEGKTPAQIAGVSEQLIAAGQNVLITRLSAEAAPEVIERVPVLKYSAVPRVATYEHKPIEPRVFGGRPVAVVTAGTSDIPVAEEALESLRMFGIAAERICDVGVAGIHRIIREIDRLAESPVVIVVAGMEGALPSVVGGLISAPVIAVPTTIGYGAALNGFTALFGMLTACSSGVTVVNIDNGFGAAVAAARMLRRERRSE